jgi:hypothetical protein
MKKTFFTFSLLSLVLSLWFTFAQTWSETGEALNDIKTWPQSAVVTLTIDVPNEYLQSKSILETATIYGIDSKVLAQKISEYYLNKFQVQELDDVSDLQAIHWIKIDDIKEIARWLQNFYPASPQQKEILVQVIKEEKILSQREFVFRSVVAIMCLYFISYFLTYRELMHHNVHKKTWNSLLFISFVWYAIIILSYLIPQIYSINMKLWFGILYQNLRIWFIIIFLWFSHALRYIFHYRPLKKRLHHKVQHHTSTHTPAHHKEIHKAGHKVSHPKHTATKLKKVK